MLCPDSWPGVDPLLSHRVSCHFTNKLAYLRSSASVTRPVHARSHRRDAGGEPALLLLLQVYLRLVHALRVVAADPAALRR
jgi:hypothetical protein